MLTYLREGDIVVVTELDRLGRNNKELTELMNQIQQKGATLEVLNLPSMTGIEDDNLRRLINNLMIELYKYQAESERKRIRERQAQGIAIAKQRGRFKGRKKKYSFEDEGLQHAFDLYQQGLTEKNKLILALLRAYSFIHDILYQSYSKIDYKLKYDVLGLF